MKSAKKQVPIYSALSFFLFIIRIPLPYGSLPYTSLPFIASSTPSLSFLSLALTFLHAVRSFVMNRSIAFSSRACVSLRAAWGSASRRAVYWGAEGEEKRDRGKILAGVVVSGGEVYTGAE